MRQIFNTVRRKVDYKRRPVLMRTLIISFILLLVGTMYSINLFFITAGIAIVYYVVRRWSVVVFSSYLSGILGALFLYTILLAIVCSAVDIFYSDFNIMLSPLLVLILLGASLGFNHLLRRKKSAVSVSKRDTPPLTDILSFSIALIVTASIVTLPFLKYGINGGILGQVNANVDDSVHFAMINDRLHFHQDSYLDNSPEVVRAEDKISYPASWHTANAVLIDAAAPQLDTGPPTLMAYIVSKILWTLTLIFFLARVTLLKLDGKNNKAVAFYFGSGLLLFFSYITATSQFLFGFYNFIPQLISLLILSSLVFNAISHPKKRDLFLLGSFVAIGGGMVWFLLLPAMGAALVAMLFYSFDKHPLRETLITIWQSFRTYPFIYFFLIGAALQQIYITTLSTESLGFIDSIILAGEVARYSQLFLTIVTIGVVTYLLLQDKKKASDMSAAVWVTVTLITFAMFILAICLIKTQEPQYYYYKVLSAIVVVLIPFCTTGFVKAFRLLEERTEYRLLWPLSTAILVVVISSTLPTFSTTGSILSYMKGERPTTSRSIDSVLRNIQPESAYQITPINYKMYYDHRSFPQSFINTMIVKANQPDSICFRGTLNTFIADNSAVSMAITAAKLCDKQHHISIVIPEQEYPIIKRLFEQQSLPNTVSLVRE